MVLLFRRLCLWIVLGVVAFAASMSAAPQRGAYQDLVALFDEFLAFERPALKDGAPDYTAATLAAKQAKLKTFQSRLAALDPKGWPVEQQVDHALNIEHLRARRTAGDVFGDVVQLMTLHAAEVAVTNQTHLEE